MGSWKAAICSYAKTTQIRVLKHAICSYQQLWCCSNHSQMLHCVDYSPTFTIQNQLNVGKYTSSMDPSWDCWMILVRSVNVSEFETCSTCSFLSVAPKKFETSHLAIHNDQLINQPKHIYNIYIYIQVIQPWYLSTRWFNTPCFQTLHGFNPWRSRNFSQKMPGLLISKPYPPGNGTITSPTDFGKFGNSSTQICL